MLKVGLTGSIAVGKTAVCSIFRELGCHVLDADLVAREVVAPGTEALAEVVREFGDGVLKPDGSLDRTRLGDIVFADEERRQKLNSIIHPRVFAEQNKWLASVAEDDPHAIAIVDAALMIESGGYKRFTKLIVVWCNAGVQLQRLMKRDGFTSDEAERRIAAQMPQEEKKRFADILIDTSAGFDETRERTVEVFEQLKSLVK